MVVVAYDQIFEKKIKKIKDSALKKKIKKHIAKIIETPDIGKPMRYSRKGTREVYIEPLRLSYVYLQNEDKIVFLELYHKDEQ